MSDSDVFTSMALVIVHTTIDQILLSMRRNGLEKTLEDLRKSVKPSKVNEKDESRWVGMLKLCEEYQRFLDNEKKGEKHEQR
jgi:hypothetical protein